MGGRVGICMYYVNPFIKKLVRIYPDGNRDGLLRLDMNENPGGLPQKLVDELSKLITPEFLSTYPDKSILLETLAQKHQLSIDNFSITDGSEMALKYIFEVFGEPGSDLITVSPTFEMYGVYANMYGVNHKKIDIEDNFDINVNKIIDSIDQNTSIVALLNPNNPIGRPYTDDEFLLVAQKAKDNNAILIIDEAYHYFYPHSQVQLLNDFDNIIILRTFSKLFSIAACRIGYAISSPKIVEFINKSRPTFDTNSIAIIFANELIKKVDICESLIKNELEGRTYLINKLKEYNYQFYYGGGNFISIKTNLNPEYIKLQLLERFNIAIKTSNYNILKNYIRVSTGEVKYMKQFFESLIEIDL